MAGLGALLGGYGSDEDEGMEQQGHHYMCFQPGTVHALLRSSDQQEAVATVGVVS